MRCSARYCPSRRECLGLSELLIHSVRQVLTQKCAFKAASGWLVAFFKLWLHNFYACLPGTLKIPLGACWKHWIAGCFQKSAPKCCRNLCAFYCATVEVSVRNGSIRKFKSNYAWLIPCHYGFVATLWEFFLSTPWKSKVCFLPRSLFGLWHGSRRARSPLLLETEHAARIAEPWNPGLAYGMHRSGVTWSMWRGRPVLGGKSQGWPQRCSSFQLQL